MSWPPGLRQAIAAILKRQAMQLADFGLQVPTDLNEISCVYFGDAERRHEPIRRLQTSGD